MDVKSYFNYFSQFQQSSYIELHSGDLLYQLQYRPLEYLSLVSRRGEELTSEIVRRDVASSGNDLNFCMRIRMANRSDDVMMYGLDTEQQYFERLKMLNTELPLLLEGRSSNDSVGVVFAHHERSYQMRPFVQVLFTLQSPQGHLNRVVYRDEIFAKGARIEFDDIDKLIRNSPRLDL